MAAAAGLTRRARGPEALPGVDESTSSDHALAPAHPPHIAEGEARGLGANVSHRERGPAPAISIEFNAGVNRVK